VTYAEGWTLADAAGGDGVNLVLNFNDYMNGCQTLIAMMITNNWNDIVDEFQESVEDEWGEPLAQFVGRFYFSLFFFLVAMIVMNIITSFVVEIYDALSDEVDL